jgi:hypothetical protein
MKPDSGLYIHIKRTYKNITCRRYAVITTANMAKPPFNASLASSEFVHKGGKSYLILLT